MSGQGPGRPPLGRESRVDQSFGSDVDESYLRYVLFEAPDDIVGPACMRVQVPLTIDMSDSFREAYCQGYRHALSDVRLVNKGGAK